MLRHLHVNGRHGEAISGVPQAADWCKQLCLYARPASIVGTKHPFACVHHHNFPDQHAGMLLPLPAHHINGGQIQFMRLVD